MKATDDESDATGEREEFPEYGLTCSFETPGRSDAVLVHPAETGPGSDEWIAIDESFAVPVERTR